MRDQNLAFPIRLEQVVPGLRIGRSGAAARPAIRGVYTEAIQGTSDPRIGFYIDEIYQSRLQQTTGAFVDLERVEVQKGPQGTLFGRNSWTDLKHFFQFITKTHRIAAVENFADEIATGF